MLITSPENNKIKYINKLKQKKYRDKENKFLIETQNLIEEASKENLLIEVYILETETLPFKVNCPVYQITKEVLSKIKDINTSKVIGICTKKNYQETGNKYLMLDKIQDPGNLGTIIRSAVAFGVTTIYLSQDCCDLYNDKTIRATEGALFKTNIIRKDLAETINKLQKENIKIYGTSPINGTDIKEIKIEKYCIIMGNEGNGISKTIKELVDENIYIKTKNVESLNVAVATSIILYELNK